MSADQSIGPIQPFIPIPTRGHRPAKYKLRDMIVSASFLVRCEKNAAVITKLSNSLTSCISSVEKRTGRRFTMRRMDGGIRIWRTR